MPEIKADDVSNKPTGAAQKADQPTTTNADDVTNEPTGAVVGSGEPTTTQADWVPDEVGGVHTAESKTVEVPEPKSAARQTRAEGK